MTTPSTSRRAEPYPLMANDISTIRIVSNESGCGATTEEYNSGTASIGTGPFKFVSYKPGESIVMERNDDYWGRGADLVRDRIPANLVRPKPRCCAARR